MPGAFSTRGRGAASPVLEDEADAGLVTALPELPTLPARRLGERLADFCRSVAALLRRRDVVETSVFAPDQVAPGVLFFVRVFAHLPAQRQDGLGIAAPGLLGRSARGIALHEEDFRIVGGALRAVGEFPRQA